MAQPVKVDFGRGRYIIMAVAVLTAMASFWCLSLAYFELRVEGVKLGQVALLALVASFFFAASLVCLVTLVVRYLSMMALRVSTRHDPTEYVNAWQVSAERMNLESDQPHEPGDDDEDIVIDDDEEEGDPDEEDEGWR